MDIRKKAASTATDSLCSHHKDNDSFTQYKMIFLSFKERPKTMLDVSLETGIERANVCRYVADMENNGLIQLLYRMKDRRTRFKAGYYTTDRSLFKSEQLKIWEGGYEKG